MKERPILFSAPMVRAILDGSKTQTRRIVPEKLYGKPVEFLPDNALMPEWYGENPSKNDPSNWGIHNFIEQDPLLITECCKQGSAGDQLWVRETFLAFGHWNIRYNHKKHRDEWHFTDRTIESGFGYAYTSTGFDFVLNDRNSGLTGWYRRPAIFMPRKVSRIDLLIKGVRVERLQDISESDARAEGIPNGDYAVRPDISFKKLWESINGTESWAANPWVWVIDFERMRP